MERPMTEWNDDRLDELNERVKLCATKEEMNLRFDAVDQRLDGIDKRFDGIDKRFDDTDKRFDGLDKRFERLESGFDRLGERFDRILHTLVVVSVGFAGTVIAAVIGLIAVVLF